MPEHTQVILISNLDDFFHKVSEIFNVFSCFGNLSKILLMKNLKKALVEYHRASDSKRAIEYMHKKAFGKSRIKVAYSKYKKIDLKRNNKSENSQNYNELIIISGKMHRFQPIETRFFYPTHTLMISVKKNANITLSDLLFTVQNFGLPKKVKTIEEGEKYSKKNLFKIILKYSGVQAATKVLAQTHNTELEGQTINVTFSDIMF